ncbi:MAG: helix-turn-helix domain-containing protein [Bryobacteraceae bacterium]
MLITLANRIAAFHHAVLLRCRMVQTARQHGIRPAARAFRCSRNTVRKWLRHFLAQG